MDINIEKSSFINFEIAVMITIYFWHPVLTCRLWTLLVLLFVLILLRMTFYYFNIVHYCWINWITWTYIQRMFSLPFDCKSSYRKTKIILVDFSPPKTQTHLNKNKNKTNTNTPRFMKYFCKVVILEGIKFRAWSVKLKTLYCILASLKLMTLSLVCDFQI